MHRTGIVAALLFFSGASALVYQMAWFRQFRLIFGASTFATAAVLAIFMGGLGIGSAILGRRADRVRNPLALYGSLELSIAAAALLSQPLLWLVARVYFATGGSVRLGIGGATIVRLLLAAVVLAVPTVLMGGTLPAAARAVESASDVNRRRLALLYGINTLGAVTGTVVATFFLLERLGNRGTLLGAVIVNALAGATALLLARKGVAPAPPPALGEPEAATAAASPRFVLLAAAVAGFAFLMMELVWYRMLAPLLGGTTFTFGLILAIALLGIALGGGAYSFWSGGAGAHLGTFALTCTAEALVLMIPFALGDRLALFANLLRPLGSVGFAGHLIGWTIVTAIVVLPAAFVAGVQFPLLIALLGRGEEGVGRDVGAAYAWNTAGAIAGSLAGGFGLLPLLGATGCWRMAAALLVALGVASAVLAFKRERRASAGMALVSGLFAVVFVMATGPTPVWRHSGIGAGRAPEPSNPNATREWMHAERRALVWDADGRESAVALRDDDDLAFIVNGKSDGSARGDAGTQVMGGVVAAMLHPDPRSALVVGLGTGSSAGWLGAVPSIERVDVVELEPVVLRVAAACAAVNHDVLRDGKVHIRIGDAREVLLSGASKYDIIFSEPSNPYRAGIASLFTAEFYRAAAARLNRGGIFAQWVQAYDVDNRTIATIYATITSVFPHVQSWRLEAGDLLLVSSLEPFRYDAATLRRRVEAEPFATAMHVAWRVEGLEGFLSHFLAGERTALLLAKQWPERNTDDRTPIEFGFARSVGEESGFETDHLIDAAAKIADDFPSVDADRHRILLQRATTAQLQSRPAGADAELDRHHRFAKAYDDDDLPAARSHWRAKSEAAGDGKTSDPWRSAWLSITAAAPAGIEPVNSFELAAVADALSDGGDWQAEQYADRLRRFNAIEADAVMARLRLKQNRLHEAADAIERALLAYRTNGWPLPAVMQRALETAALIARDDKQYGPRMYAALEEPFAAGQWNDLRLFYLVLVAYEQEQCGPRTIRALHAQEPNVMWRELILRVRKECYGDARALRDYEAYHAAEPAPLVK
jgi:spermidine synthase